MAIRQIIPGTKFMAMSGMSSQLQTATAKALTDGAVQTTIFSECIGGIPVFADAGSSDDAKNDFSSIISFEQQNTALQYFLLDGQGNEIAELNDNTYGEYFPKGFLSQANGFSFAQSQYIGVRVDWKKIFSLLGFGTYQLKLILTPIGVFKPRIAFSCLYNLCQYTEDRADETVRLDVTRNGNILNEDLEFLGTEWKQQFRFRGFFGHKQRKLTRDDYLNKDRRTMSIQKTLFHEYTLTPYNLNQCLRSELDKWLLAEKLEVSDYNIFNTDNLKRIDVIPLTIESEYFDKSRFVDDNIKLEERSKGRVHRVVE